MYAPDRAASDAIARSVFGRLPPEALARILADCRDVSLEAGHRCLGPDHPASHRTGLVVAGLLRLYVESADGRQLTVRYAGPGYFLGAGLAESGRHRVLVPWGVQAVTAARVLYLDRERLGAAARADAAVAWALLAQTGEYHRDTVHLLAGTAFGSIRQRVAMHLLNLAARRDDGQEKGPLVAPVTQQALADAVGTTRETVAGALAGLRGAGLIATARGAILLRDAEGLAEESAQGSGVDQEPV